MLFQAFQPKYLIALLVTGSLLGYVSSAGAQQIGEGAQLSQKLATGSLSERAAALAEIQYTPVANRSAAVFQALLDEVDRQAARLRSKKLFASVSHGEGEGEQLLAVLRTVCQHNNDPRIIPHLMPFLENGGCVIDVLANFGEQSLPGIVTVARSNTSPDINVSAALLTLQRMIERAPSRPLSDASRRLIVQTAELRLQGRQPYIIAVGAVELATKTRNAALVERIKRVSTNPDAAAELGIESEMIPQFQIRAKAALEKVSK